MAKRVITSVVGLPILLAFVYFGGIPLQLGFLILSCIALTEFYSALNNSPSKIPGNIIEFPARGRKFLFPHISVNYVSYMFTALYYLLLPYVANSAYFFILITMFIIVLMVVMVFFFGKVNIRDCAIALFGFFYTAFPLSFIYLIREQKEYGIFIVWLVFITAFGCDVFAYFAGRAFGRHKLAPDLSPNKTVEGAVGGIAGACLLSVLFGMFVYRWFPMTEINARIIFAIVGIVGAIFATFGDLAASSVKRYTKIKDFGKIFPGHGGVLDRFDSVIFAAPMMYIAILLLPMLPVA